MRGAAPRAIPSDGRRQNLGVSRGKSAGGTERVTDTTEDVPGTPASPGEPPPVGGLGVEGVRIGDDGRPAAERLHADAAAVAGAGRRARIKTRPRRTWRRTRRRTGSITGPGTTTATDEHRRQHRRSGTNVRQSHRCPPLCCTVSRERWFGGSVRNADAQRRRFLFRKPPARNSATCRFAVLTREAVGWIGLPVPVPNGHGRRGRDSIPRYGDRCRESMIFTARTQKPPA
jgi:hypothetical protein